MKKWIVNIAVWVFIMFMVGPEVAAQCPMCKAAVEQSANGLTHTARGLNNGILYLFILPYSMILMIGFIIYMGYRKNKKQKESMLTDEPLTDSLT